ncbi:hypothetical protein RF55_420 [Lasius niger]|uniref:Uncharacterized protein n=1 Tax=Lasius niger TaxID=67767 RepID=A0A0J7L9G2_LASNI|nr:hypothetical protein RF55_420 [Lasius niger]
MKRTLSLMDESQQGGSSMEKKIDWLVYKIKDDMVSKKEIKNMIIDIVKYETENLKKEMEEMKRMIGNFNKTMKDELQKMVNTCTSMERGEVKKSYSEVMKRNQTESVLVIKPKDGEENKSSEDTKRDVRKIDITKLGVGITRMKKVKRGAVVVGCENRVQAEKLKQEVVKDLGKKYEIQVPKKRKPKVKIFDVDNEDCENEQIFWEKIEEQNEMQKNTIEGKIIRKVTKANFKKTLVIAEGFLKHKEEIENELIIKYKPSVIGFTETHVTKQIEEHELHINGYVCVRGDSESSRTGGVLLYIKEGIRFDMIGTERVMNSLGLRQLVKEATRIVQNSETLIDLVFGNVEMDVEVWHEPKITDHSAIVVYWNLEEQVDENKAITYRDYKRIDREKFKELISIGLDVIEGDNVNILANLMVKEIIRCLDVMAPLKTIVLRQKWQGKCWYCEDIKLLIKQRDEAYKVARISKTEEDWEVFRQLRNKTVDICRKAKRGYLEEQLDKNKKDPKSMWSVLKELMKGKRSDKEYKEVQLENRIIYKVEEMADIFNCYFVNSIRLLNSNDHIEDVIEYKRYSDNVWEVFEKIEEKQLYIIVRNLENKAGTEEGINVEECFLMSGKKQQ